MSITCFTCVADEPLKKPVPLHEQTVKDEKGRYKRFHGAFTGGFSAGYFNTVGSKEGEWCCVTTPAVAEDCEQRTDRIKICFISQLCSVLTSKIYI